MKLNKAKRAKNAVAALILGSMAFAPNAFSVEATRQEGLNLDDLQRVVHDLELKMEGRKLRISGLVPRACVDPRRPEIKTISEAGKNVIMIRMEGCEGKSSAELKDEELVPLQQYLAAKELADITGPITLRHLKATGQVGTRARNGDEELPSVRIISSADKAKADAAADEAARKLALEALQTNVTRLCRNGDMIGVGAAIEAARDILGDVSELMEKASIGQRDAFKAELAAARTAAAAKDVLERYRQAASQNGWDEAALDSPYIEKRFTIATRLVEDLKTDSELKSPAVAKEIESLRRELREMDRDIYRRKLNDIAMLYGDLYAHEDTNGNTNLAMEYASRAREFANAEGKGKMDAAMMKSYAAAFKACVKKNPERMEACEKKFASKSQAIAERVRDSLAAKAERSEDGMEEYQAFNEQYVQTFGQGPVYNWSGYGRSTPYSPGAFEQYKQQALQQYQMNMYQRMMSGQMNGMTSRGPLF